jgi:serine/threonine protein kinase
MNDTPKQRAELKCVKQLCTGIGSKRPHPHVIHVFNTMQVKAEEDECPRLCIQMELCDDNLGGFLKLSRAKGENLQANHVLCILIQILDGLLYCHSREIIHRDLKPQNGILRMTINLIASAL